MSPSATRLHAALIFAASVFGTAPLAAQEAPGGVDLASLLPRAADLWVEIPDLERLSSGLASTRLAHLLERLASEIDPADLALHLALPADLPDELLEDPPADMRELLGRLALELGLAEEQSEQLLDSLSGSLNLAVLARQEPKGDERSGWVVAAGLEAGGSTTLVDAVVAALERSGPPSERPELVELERDGPESRAAWRWTLPGARAKGYLVVRPQLLAWCFDRELALSLLHSIPQAASAAARQLELRRVASRSQGELIFVRLSGSRLAQLSTQPDVRVLTQVLALDRIAGFELGLRTTDGTLRSRLRFDKPADLDGPHPAAANAWGTLAVLPSDCLAVVGLRVSPWKLGQGLAHIAGAWGDHLGGGLVTRLADAPFFAALGEPGVLADETLLFARAAGAGAPALYLATPATRALDKPFVALVNRGEDSVPLGRDLRLVRKRLGSVDAWVLFDDQSARSRSLFALAPCAGTWVLSDVSAQLQNLVYQRERERLAVREAELNDLRAALSREIAASGYAFEQMSAFVHVKSARIAEWVWPYVLIALEFTGVVEDSSELPDALELAEFMGDTTTLVFDLDDAIEVRGNGLLGGLGLLL